LWLTT
ncbi:hypothetical protein ECEC1868_3619, partial [Escherichia coli EC1868]